MFKLNWLTAIASATLLAQAPKVVEKEEIHVITAPGGHGPGSAAFTWVSAEANFEAALVKGVPFTADFVTENSQTLADGNRIRTTNTAAFARDGEGRTRREVSIDAIGPFAGGAPRKTIFINDPVAKIDYILDPQAKTARKIKIGAMMGKVATAHAGNGAQTMVFNRRIDGEGAKDVLVETQGKGPVTVERSPLPQGIAIHDGHGAVISQKITGVQGRTAVAGAANVKNEPLGKRIIEGVEAEGTRSTLSIPAGQIGNDRPLDTVSERWYSNELKTVVMTTRKDPRTGESNYKIANLRRGEPARQLFEVPPDYKIEVPPDYKIIEDGGAGNVIRMKVETKE